MSDSWPKSNPAKLPQSRVIERLKYNGSSTRVPEFPEFWGISGSQTGTFDVVRPVYPEQPKMAVTIARPRRPQGGEMDATITNAPPRFDELMKKTYKKVYNMAYRLSRN